MIALRRSSVRSSLHLVRQQAAPTCRRSLGTFTQLHVDNHSHTRTYFRLEASQWRGRNSLPLTKKYFSSEGVEIESLPKPDRKPVRILYGTQGGTAQLFSMQLADAIAEVDPEREVTTLGLHESSTPAEILDPEAIHIFFVSVAGIGEPPDNAREFYNWLMDESDTGEVKWSNIDYSVFGLGNQQAHPHHFNVIGKNMDARLEKLGANRVHELGLGDDGEVIEDDADIWIAGVVSSLTRNEEATEGTGDSIEAETKEIEPETPAKQDDTPNQTLERHFHGSYQTIVLHPPEELAERGDLFHLQDAPSPFYNADTRKMRVRHSGPISVGCGDYGMREICISIEDYPDLIYEAGDHVMIYPRNSNCIVDAYLYLLGVDPNTVVEENLASVKRYPHPTGLTLRETLSHCVDLGALPSPSFSRELLERKDVNYKEEVARARRTPLDLMYESRHVPTLEELLLNLPPMKPRYYSIASSPLKHPREIYITYRPVKYVNSKGMLREGVCTSYLSDLGVTHDEEGHDENYSFLPGAVSRNPTFRLPKDASTPIILVAGGCGVAPIRAFLEERIATKDANYGDGHVFLGFRNPQDEVYRSILDHALECGAVTTANVSYSAWSAPHGQKCALVSDTIIEHGKTVFEAFEKGAYIYVCGGARLFGVAIEKALIRIVEQQGNMSTDDAVAYLRVLSKEGRLCEDYAD